MDGRCTGGPGLRGSGSRLSESLCWPLGPHCAGLSGLDWDRVGHPPRTAVISDIMLDPSTGAARSLALDFQ